MLCSREICSLYNFQILEMKRFGVSFSATDHPTVVAFSFAVRGGSFINMSAVTWQKQNRPHWIPVALPERRGGGKEAGVPSTCLRALRARAGE